MFTKKDLQKLIIPIIIEQFLMITIGMADTIMVTSVGEAAVSSVSLIDSINILLINIFSALATGGAVVAAQFLGRKDYKNANLAAKQLILVVLVLSTSIAVLCVMIRQPILNLLFGNVEPAVMENALIYFKVSAYSYPFIALYNSGAALFRSMQNSKIAMITALFMNIINISVNAILIYGFHLGVLGAAVGSLVSRFACAIGILALLRNKRNPIYIRSFLKLSFHPQMAKNILGIGIPNGIENGMFQIGKILVQGLIASFGTIALAANAVASSIANFAIIPGSAIGLAMITVVGQCVGQNDYNAAKKYMIDLTKMAYLGQGALNLAVLCSAGFIVSFFSLLPETNALATQLIIYHSICCILLWPLSFSFPNGLRAANDVKFTMLTAIMSMWIFRIGFSYLLGRYLGLGVLGVWMAMTLDWLVRLICFLLRFKSGKWIHKQLVA